jgi:sarcosine oxidase, subunit beta
MSTLKQRTADFVIVGAGVMGSSLAFHLAKRKAGRIVVLDKGYVGQGASGRSSALIRMHYSFPPEVFLAVKSLEIFQNWKEIVGEQGEFRRTGFVRVVPREEMDCLVANVKMQKECGAKVDLITCDDLKQIEPDWNLDDNPGLAYEPDAGYGDGSVVANDFMAAARSMGVEYRPKTQVTRFVVHDGYVRGVETELGEIEAPVVVGATGQWSRALFKEAGVDLPIETELHSVAILRNPPGLQGGGCACIDSTLTTYFRPDGFEKTLIGDFYGKRGIDAEDFPQSVNPAWFEEIIEKAAKRIPKLQHAEIMKGITGVYDMSPDSRPILGETSEIQGLYVVAGFSGMGFKISPAIGLVMSELLLDRAGHTVDIRPFRPSRFAEGKLIKADFEYRRD